MSRVKKYGLKIITLLINQDKNEWSDNYRGKFLVQSRISLIIVLLIKITK